MDAAPSMRKIPPYKVTGSSYPGGEEGGEGWKGGGYGAMEATVACFAERINAVLAAGKLAETDVPPNEIGSP